MLRRKPRTTPDEWGAANRIYPPTSGVPGPRDPGLTPYMIAFGRAAASGDFKRVVGVVGSQMGKTDTMLDVIGQRLDQRPVPVLYVGPTRDFVVDQFEPRVMSLLNESASLAAKTARGKANKKVRKLVSGVPLRLAHAGSSAALKSDPAGLALVDEYDELLANVKGQGDPLGLVEARGYTYGGEFTTMIASTPSVGSLETEIDPETGLEFWKDAEPEDVPSPVWKLFQEGTKYHWAWPCPHCDAHFIPRFKHLRWPDKATPAQARRGAFMCCPVNGCVIEDSYETRASMNAGGVFVAKGQRIENGEVIGAPPDSSTWSMWTSGLCSPFVSWGERAEGYLKALATGEDAKVQTAINAGFGECFAAGGKGEAPEWEEVRNRARPYALGELPDGIAFAVAGIDVGKYSIHYVVRGFGARAASWLLDYGQLYGPTDDDEIWDQLFGVLSTDYNGLTISRAFIDSGFRPDKPNAGSEHRVYAFARRYQSLVRATKGHDVQQAPITGRRIEVTLTGGKAKGSLELMHLNSDFFKSLVHQRIKASDGRPEAWYLPEGIDEDYCRQIVSEARTIAPSGKPVWVKKQRANHLLDCESMAAAAAYQLRAHNLTDEMVQRFIDARTGIASEPDTDDAGPSPAMSPPPPPQAMPARRPSYLGPSRKGWLG